jgi:HSP20 family molecular chaperone IbpA
LTDNDNLMPSQRGQRRSPIESPKPREWSPEVEILDDDRYVLIIEAKLPRIRLEDVKVQVEHQSLTIKGFRADPESREDEFRPYSIVGADGTERHVIGPPLQHFERRFSLPATVDIKKAVAGYNHERSILTVRLPKTDLPPGEEISTETRRERDRLGIARITGKPIALGAHTLGIPFSIDFAIPDSPNVAPPAPSSDASTMLEDDRIINKGGVRFLPLSLAAPLAQAPRTTLLDWIKAKAKFQGSALQTYHSPTLRRFYLSEESVERVANRFIKWPSKEPAGPVKLGETKDHTGYIGIAKAARTIAVDHHTMWLWTAHGTAPVDKPLDVIKCTASDQFYIREKDVLNLKKFIPRSGLKRGRRPQAPQP